MTENSVNRLFGKALVDPDFQEKFLDIKTRELVIRLEDRDPNEITTEEEIKTLVGFGQVESLQKLAKLYAKHLGLNID